MIPIDIDKAMKKIQEDTDNELWKQIKQIILTTRRFDAEEWIFEEYHVEPILQDNMVIIQHKFRLIPNLDYREKNRTIRVTSCRTCPHSHGKYCYKLQESHGWSDAVIIQDTDSIKQNCPL